MVNGPMAVNAPSSRMNPPPMRASFGGTPAGNVVVAADVGGAELIMELPLGIRRRIGAVRFQTPTGTCRCPLTDVMGRTAAVWGNRTPRRSIPAESNRFDSAVRI